jgi:hypothetical protein
VLAIIPANSRAYRRRPNWSRVMSNDKWKRPSAYQHGVFSRTAIVPGEDPEEFEELYSDLIKEWAPVGATEEDAVLSIAKAMWSKRRAQKFIQIEVTLNSTNPRHPSYDEYRTLSGLVNLLRAIPDNFEVYANNCLDADTIKYLTGKFPRSKYNSSQVRADAIIKEIESILMPKVNFTEPAAPEYGPLLLSSRTFTADFFDKELKLDERLDIMIDRAFKRLIQIKAMKQVLSQTGAERGEDRVRKIGVKKAANG